MRKIYFILMLPLIVPHLICYRFSKNRWKIDADVERYEGVVKKTDCKVLRLAYLLVFQKEFRNLFYYRLGRWSILLRYLPKLSTLYINVPGGKKRLEKDWSFNMDFPPLLRLKVSVRIAGLTNR